ncbi:villin-like protein [Volvox carteri f. nagariensis]|uniref:Villin-like protein n=1 Tax=Volvox carteri f. nagariensis TaxID=3068 RepID=D8UCU3_VOLCA|nr:villin-like protein [Volvox carteri f. nagariensis]EFJ42450.1 villin-like protein [Volvox carteri f. nagariensis]|eukprot:XP_002956513.1 villin-like protein [Volvox carteri f. nagariensis]
MPPSAIAAALKAPLALTAQGPPPAPIPGLQQCRRTGPTSPDPSIVTSSIAARPTATRITTTTTSAATAVPSMAIATCRTGTTPFPMSLQECCCKVIIRHVSVYNCLELLAVVRGHQAPSLEAIAAACVRYAVNSFEMLQGLCSEVQLRQALSDEVYDNLVSAQQERLQAVADMRRVGRVLDRQPLLLGDGGPRQVPSVSGRYVSYPPEALQAGLSWPEGVQALDRETWLAEEDFKRLFEGLEWAEYSRLPEWRKTRLKQAAGLF